MQFANVGSEKLPFLINPNLVRAIKATNSKQCRIYFDKDHTVLVNSTADAVSQKIELAYL